jgi:hypothetical protein
MSSRVVTKQMLIDLDISLGAINNSPLIAQLEQDSNASCNTKPKECREEIQRVKGALQKISPDVPRGNGSINLEDDELTNYWLGIIWAIASLDCTISKTIARKWSQGSDRYTDEGFEAAWDAYNPNHTNPIGIRSVYKLAQVIEVKSRKSLVFEQDCEAQKSLSGQIDTSTPTPYTFLTTEQLQSLPKTTWRVKDLLPDKGLASIYGPSGSGKSFLALDLMATIVRGTSFYGSKTNPCPVVYVALEGTGGIARRIEAYETYHNIKLPNTFRIVTDMLSLFDSDAKIFAAAVKEAGLHGGVIVIDTLAQSAPGSDENSSADMGRIISNAQLLQRETNGLVVLIHHTGKDASRGARGHSSLFASLDAAIEVKRPTRGREWHRAKVKDGEDGVVTSFKLEHVALGTDEDGDEISSCVAVGDLYRTTQPKTPSGKNQRPVLAALRIKYPKAQLIPASEVLVLAGASLPTQSSNNKQRAKEAVRGLVELGHLEHEGDNYKIL